MSSTHIALIKAEALGLAAAEQVQVLDRCLKFYPETDWPSRQAANSELTRVIIALTRRAAHHARLALDGDYEREQFERNVGIHLARRLGVVREDDRHGCGTD
jgi:hypothetical protein